MILSGSRKVVKHFTIIRTGTSAGPFSGAAAASVAADSSSRSLSTTGTLATLCLLASPATVLPSCPRRRHTNFGTEGVQADASVVRQVVVSLELLELSLQLPHLTNQFSICCRCLLLWLTRNRVWLCRGTCASGCGLSSVGSPRTTGGPFTSGPAHIAATVSSSDSSLQPVVRCLLCRTITCPAA